MLNLVIFGAPGSGKGTQSDRLIDEFGLFHISTGDVLRNHIAQGTPLGNIASTYIAQGRLIPDELMIQILEDVLDNNRDHAATGVIFDGFPRTVAQAEALEELLKKRGAQVDAVIGLEVDEDELVDRLIQRGKREGRTDDNPETIQKRLKVYHESTQPVRDFYADRGKYTEVRGTGTIDAIYRDIKDALKHLQMRGQNPDALPTPPAEA